MLPIMIGGTEMSPALLLIGWFYWMLKLAATHSGGVCSIAGVSLQHEISS